MSTDIHASTRTVMAPSATATERVDVIGIGVQKAATTWIFSCLAEHPEIHAASIEPPGRKELNFFNHDYERGYWWYHRRFTFGPWKTVEFSTLYFHDHDVPARIHRYSPDVRLLLALRNPIDRAFSQHKHEIRKRDLTGRLQDFWTALEQNPSYIEQGLYATHLERWLGYFGADQIHIVLYDDIVSRPLDVITEVYRFVGVDPGHRPASLDRRVNVAAVRRWPGLNRWLRTASRTASKAFGETFVHGVRATGIPAFLRARNRVERDRADVPPLTPSERARLGAFFAAENTRLAELLGRDLSIWR